LNNKKGISPLIATVLIIGFTIVVAVLVITWINNLVGSQTDEQGCTADALSVCTDATRFLSFEATADDKSNDINIKASNSGPNEYTVRAILLDDSGSVVTDGNVLLDSDADATNGEVVSGYSDGLHTYTITATGVYSVRFVTEVEGTYGDYTCTEICGDGETRENLDITV